MLVKEAFAENEDVPDKSIIRGEDPDGVARRLVGGLAQVQKEGSRNHWAVNKIYDGFAANYGFRMGKRGRKRVPPTREEYNLPDWFIGTMVGLQKGEDFRP